MGLVLVPSGWIVVDNPFTMVELGSGFRVARGTILKASYRIERWDNPSVRYPDGNAFEVQVTHRFDVLDWLQ